MGYELGEIKSDSSLYQSRPYTSIVWGPGITKWEEFRLQIVDVFSLRYHSICKIYSVLIPVKNYVGTLKQNRLNEWTRRDFGWYYRIL